MDARFADIGERLRAYRLGKGLNADQIAERLGVSRAAVYRIEAGEIIKIDTLHKLAQVLDASIASLLGVGVEYYSSAVGYFERMRQIEEKSDQVIAHFPPLSYLLTSKDYARHLKQTLIETVPTSERVSKKYLAEIDRIIAILDERKLGRQKRHLSVVNLVNLPEIERWLKLGVVGRFNHAPDEVAKRRMAARREIEHLITMIENEPMGVQIGLIEDALPNVAFQLFRTADRTLLGLSPFRLGGELPNIRTGFAMLTGDQEPVRLYETLATGLWKTAAKGSDASAQLKAVLSRSAIAARGARKAP